MWLLVWAASILGRKKVFEWAIHGPRPNKPRVAYLAVLGSMLQSVALFSIKCRMAFAMGHLWAMSIAHDY